MQARLTSTILIGTFFLLLLSGCTLDPIPVHPSQVQVARNQAKPVESGPSAKGARKAVWDFDKPDGYVYDPGKIEFNGGSAHLKEQTGSSSRFAQGRVTLETSGGRPFAALNSFVETRIPGAGTIRYQLSPDGSKWFFHNGKRWTQAQARTEDTNSAEDVNSHIASFSVEAGTGTLFWRAWFISPTGAESTGLKNVEIGVNEAPLDYWD